MMDSPTLDADEVADALTTLGLAPDRQPAYRALVGDVAPVELLGRALTDCAFRLPMARLIEAHISAGGSTHGYEFRWRSPALGGLTGAAHCLDVPFAFDVLDAEGVEAYAGPTPPQALATEMHRAWVAFVTTGDPGWVACSTGRQPRWAFDATAGLTTSGLVEDPVAAERSLWDTAD